MYNLLWRQHKVLRDVGMRSLPTNGQGIGDGFTGPLDCRSLFVTELPKPGENGYTKPSGPGTSKTYVKAEEWESVDKEVGMLEVPAPTSKLKFVLKVEIMGLTSGEESFDPRLGGSSLRRASGCCPKKVSRANRKLLGTS